jgi:hypothetical protein
MIIGGAGAMLEFATPIPALRLEALRSRSQGAQAIRSLQKDEMYRSL